MTKTLETTFLLGALLVGTMNFSPASAACDQEKVESYCLNPWKAKMSACGNDEDCIHRWKMARAKCICDLGCPEVADTPCEEARAYCAKDEKSHRCDDLRN